MQYINVILLLVLISLGSWFAYDVNQVHRRQVGELDLCRQELVRLNQKVKILTLNIKPVKFKNPVKAVGKPTIGIKSKSPKFKKPVTKEGENV